MNNDTNTETLSPTELDSIAVYLLLFATDDEYPTVLRQDARMLYRKVRRMQESSTTATV